MDFTLFRGRDFQETFNFKTADGKSMTIPSGNLRIILERGTFGREYKPGKGLTKQRTQIVWQISKQESANFDFSTMYYTLYLDDTELARGVLRIQ